MHRKKSLKAGEERKKRPRTAFTASQIKALEQEFEKNKYLSVSKRLQLSKQLKLTETQDAEATVCHGWVRGSEEEGQRRSGVALCSSI
ncbi:hypothetical protein O3P69_001936 [Scylla paramamosain]|uniref:Homeobox domain-containing protein n=1 Tax=Scylla paramamosain TaxID=85552 RepID=A0AAW0V3B3_SCYPA